MLITFVLSFLLTLLVMPKFINYMKSQQFGQVSREEGPSWHQAKDGTPTMGGTVFLVTSTIATIIGASIFGWMTSELALFLMVLVFFGIIGFLDDFIKIFHKQNEGLTSSQKFILQLGASLLFAIIYILMGLDITIYLPFIGNVASIIVFIAFVMLWVTGFSNAVNLTDGLDGLVAGTGTIAYATYAYFAWQQGNNSILLACLSVVAGLLAFFIFNKKPAKIFMGDVGSLALGAGLAAIAIILKIEWSLLIVGFIFVMETLSVILQVLSFKTTGKRIFKMSPIHHHFEMVGWSEVRVVTTFWIIGLIASALALFIL